MKEYKINIQLPSTLTVNMPAFSEMDFERTFQALSSETAINLITSTIARRIAEKFLELNSEEVSKHVSTFIGNNREKIINAITDKLDIK